MSNKNFRFKIIDLTKKYCLFFLLALSGVTYLAKVPVDYNVPTVDIIVSLIPMIFTVLILSLSISDKEIFGVKISEISKYRKDFHFDFFEMIIVAILIFAFSAIFQIFHLTISIWLTDVVAILYSIWFLLQEMPFIKQDNEKIKRILTNNIKLGNNDDKLGNNSTNAFNNNVLLYIILKEGLYNAFDIVKNDDQSHNREKLLELITMEINFCFDLVEIKKSDSTHNPFLAYKDIDFFVVFDNAFLSLEKLLDHKNKNNLVSLLGKDSYYLVTRLLFVLRVLANLMNCNSRYIDKVSYLFKSNIRSINFGQFSNEETLLFNKIINAMAVYSISKDEKPSLWFFEILRDYVLDIKFLFRKEQGYFWFLSIYLYFVSKIYKRAPEPLKNEINKFISARSKGLNSDGISWKEAIHLYMNYGNFDEKIKLFNEVINIYKADIGPGPWYMPPYSSSWSSEDGEFSLSFVINNLIGILVYDYNSFYYKKGEFNSKIVKNMSQEDKRSLSYVLNLNWFDGTIFKCDKLSLEMLCYFSSDFKTHSIINRNSVLINDLNEERNNLVIVTTKQLLKDSHVTDSAMDTYKEMLINGLKKGISKCEFLDDKLKLDESDLKEYSLLIDVFGSKQLVKGYAESLSNSIYTMLYEDFKKEKIETIKLNDDNEDEILEKLKSRNFDYKSKDLKSVFYNSKKNLENIGINNLKTVNLHLQGCVFWKENAVRINVECADELCTVNRLTDKQVNEIVDKDYKVSDGLYKFVGYYNNESAYITREAAIKIVKDKYILARVVFKKKTELKNGDILILRY